jgi:hypothetical protein
MRYLWILSLALLLACNDTPATPGDTATVQDVADTQVADATPDGDAPCWWCTDASADADVPNLSKDTTGKPGKDVGDEKEYVVWAGNIDMEAGQGTYMYDYQMSGLKCSITYTVTALTAAEGCDACEFAWSLTLGDIEASELMEKCPEGMGKEGSTVHYGHSPDGAGEKGTGAALLADLGDGWVPVGISIPPAADKWVFYHLLQSGGGDKGDDKTDAQCMEACLAKGASEEECKAACAGDDKGGDGKGGDKTDEQCMDACLAKGLSEEECNDACPDDGTGGDGKGDGKTEEQCMEACLAKGASEEECKDACAP